MTSWLATFCSI